MDVNAEKRAEGKSLQDAHEFRRIIDAIPQAIVVYSPDGQPVYINRVSLEYAGLSIEEVRADRFHDRVVHPEDIERLREARQDALSRGAPFEYELRALKRGGQYCWNLIQYNPQKTNKAGLSDGSQPQPTSTTAREPSSASKTKTLLCVRRSTAPRCLRKLSVLANRCVR